MCKFVLKPMDARQENNFTGSDSPETNKKVRLSRFQSATASPSVAPTAIAAVKSVFSIQIRRQATYFSPLASQKALKPFTKS